MLTDSSHSHNPTLKLETGENQQNLKCPKTGASALESEADSFDKVFEACSKPGVVTGKA